jgi:uncharacterized protein YjlB
MTSCSIAPSHSLSLAHHHFSSSIMSLKLLSVSSVVPTIITLPHHRNFPNAASGLPVVHYHPFASNEEAFDPSAIESLVSKHGFEPQWRYPMYNFDHFHSTTHELLVPFRGSATLVLGGIESIDVRAGDVLLLPAGVAHRAESTQNGFCMVGSYPTGSKAWDICKGGEEGVESKISGLGNGEITMDPIYGKDASAPIMKAWKL